MSDGVQGRRAPSGFPWYVEQPGARLHLICLPHAGGLAAAYRQWSVKMPPGVQAIAFEAPGRSIRLRERPVTTMRAMVDDVVSAIAAIGAKPRILFGHSLGGYVAFEVARQLQAARMPPAGLVISGAAPPEVLASQQQRGLRHLPDAEFLAAVSRFGGMPPELLDMSDLVSLILPALRNDFTIFETWQPDAGHELECPTLVVSGRDDEDVDFRTLDGWQEYVQRPIEVRLFRGGHFYLRNEEQEIIQAMLRWLQATGAL